MVAVYLLVSEFFFFVGFVVLVVVVVVVVVVINSCLDLFAVLVVGCGYSVRVLVKDFVQLVFQLFDPRSFNE